MCQEASFIVLDLALWLMKDLETELKKENASKFMPILVRLLATLMGKNQSQVLYYFILICMILMQNSSIVLLVGYVQSYVLLYSEIRQSLVQIQEHKILLCRFKFRNFETLQCCKVGRSKLCKRCHLSTNTGMRSPTVANFNCFF